MIYAFFSVLVMFFFCVEGLLFGNRNFRLSVVRPEKRLFVAVFLTRRVLMS